MSVGAPAADKGNLLGVRNRLIPTVMRAHQSTQPPQGTTQMNDTLILSYCSRVDAKIISSPSPSKIYLTFSSIRLQDGRGSRLLRPDPPDSQALRNQFPRPVILTRTSIPLRRRNNNSSKYWSSISRSRSMFGNVWCVSNKARAYSLDRRNRFMMLRPSSSWPTAFAASHG